MPVDESAQQYKMVVLGGGGVGKSALTIRLVTDNFLEEYDPTIEDNYSKNATVDDVPCVLNILDTAGQDEYSQMQDEWMREGRGFLIVYAIDNWASFNEVRMYKEKILRVKEADSFPMVLVGNKCDLEDAREISTDQGQELAKEWGCEHFETSAKACINHTECFHEVVRQIRAFEAGGCTTPDGPIKPTRRCLIL